MKASDQPLEDWRPGVTTRLIAAAANGATALCVFEQRSQPGTGAPRHRHPHDEEVIVVTEGVAEFHLDGHLQHISEGDAVIVPPGVVHGFVNNSKNILRTIAIFGSALPTVIYEREPDVTLTIGASGADRIRPA